MHHIIDGYDKATEKPMSDYDINRTKMKIYYIAKVLHYHINSAPTDVYNAPDKLDWIGCYIATLKDTKEDGNYKAKKSDTVMVWYRQFREEITLPFIKIGNNALPTDLQANREAAMIIQSYGKDCLADLDCKMKTEYIHNTLIPELEKKETTTNVEFLKRYNLTKICDNAVLKWMHVLGF